jgi:lipoate-protein ligase A
VVDHRDDWTYALIIPREHELYEARAPESYRLVHACIAESLNVLAVPAMLKEPDKAPADVSGKLGPGVCFTRAEIHDVVQPHTGTKIAGAAQKRSKLGMLFQGSIARSAVAAALDWDKFEELFADRLGKALGLPSVTSPWPEISDDEVAGLTEQYSLPEWNEFR